MIFKSSWDKLKKIETDKNVRIEKFKENINYNYF